MNQSAANALLKILEEPPSGKFLLLLSPMPNLLLPTIRSRCSDIFFNRLSQKEMKEWLREKKIDGAYNELFYELSEGAPLRMEQLLNEDRSKSLMDFYAGLKELSGKKQDPLHFAHHWQDIDTLYAIDIMLYYVEKNVRDLAGKRIHDQNRYRLYDTLMERKRLLSSQFNLNRTLLLEECCILLYGQEAY